MKLRNIVVAGVFALAGCGQAGLFAPSNTAQMPLNSFGGPELSQDQAIALAGWALDDPANTAGQPARAARAIAAEDWLAGQTQLYGNFGSYSPSGEVSWTTFRQQTRDAIGVGTQAPSQEVVKHLLAAADALDAGKIDAAKADLASPVFSLGPDGTLRALTNLPRLPGRDWAFADLRRNDDRTFGTYSGSFR